MSRLLVYIDVLKWISWNAKEGENYFRWWIRRSKLNASATLPWSVLCWHRIKASLKPVFLIFSCEHVKLFFIILLHTCEWNELILRLRLQLWTLKQHGFNMKGLTLIVIFHSISICLCIWFDDTGDRGSFCSPLTEGRTPVPMGPGYPPFLTLLYPHLVNLLTSLTSPLSCWPF